MKIQELVIHNIASIENARIDFSASPLSESDVFLITGKTGSGKSTLLDAICLALYGTTPRLEGTRMQGAVNDSGKAVQIDDPAQLLKEGAGEGYVRLSFEGSDGVPCLAEWSVARARNRPTGKLQPRKWSFKNLHSGMTCTRESEIKTAVLQAVGLTFGQFCRTTMLAQGEFTRFLNSKDEEKAEILEMITGVDVYSRIGEKLYGITREKEKAYRVAQEALRGITLLTDEQKAMTREGIKRKKEENALAVRQMEDVQVKVGWLEHMALLSKEEEKAVMAFGIAEAGMGEALVAARKQAEETAEEARKEKERTGLVLKEAERVLEAAGLSAIRKEGKELAVQNEWIGIARERLNAVRKTEEARIREAETWAGKEIEMAGQVTERGRLYARLCDSKTEMEVTGRVYEAEISARNNIIGDIRRKLRPGDFCPVCMREIEMALPTEAEVAVRLKPIEDAYLGARKVYEEQKSALDRLDATISAEKRQLEERKKAYGRDTTLPRQIASALAALNACGVAELDERAEFLLGEKTEQIRQRKVFLDQKEAEGEILEKRVEEARKAHARSGKLYEIARDALDQAAKAISNAQASILAAKASLETIRRQIRDHAAKKPELAEEDTLETLRERQHACNAGILHRAGEITLLDEALKRDRENQEKTGRLAAKAEELRMEWCKWARLDEMIGDLTGKKFRKIAQSYVLGSLVQAANHYMRDLSDRYVLRVVPGTFIISVEDAWQGFASRPASTISGGESFLVSLSLALALSDIGDTLSVDTLFIDEGFGTLSGKPLQNAVDTLKTLRTKAGRHVGIISHIEELRERIPIQIRVDMDGRTGSSSVSVAD